MMRFIFIFFVFTLTTLECFGQIGIYNNDTLYIHQDAEVFVMGDLVNQHEVFNNNGNFKLVGNLRNIKDLSINGNGTFSLIGDKTHDINLLGEFKTHNLEISNSNGAVFYGDKNLIVKGDLDFIDGIFYTQTNNLIQFDKDALYFDADDFSHIDGPAIKVGSTQFTFPIGKEGRLRPMRISDTNLENIYQAEYFASTAPTLVTDATLNNVSDWEFWSFNQISGNSLPKISLVYDELSFIDFDEESLTIGYRSLLDVWSMVEASTMLPEQLETDISTINSAPGDGLYTFASTRSSFHIQDGVVDFKLNKAGCDVIISWSTIERSRRVSSYSLMRSSFGNSFEEIYSVEADNDGLTDQYAFRDTNVKDREVYQYQVVTKYSDGTSKLTDVKFIKSACTPITFVLYPNPVILDDQLTLQVDSEINKNIEITIVDVLGRVLQERTLEITKGNSQYIIGDTQHYGAAEYFIWTPLEEDIPTIKFQIIR